MNKFNCLNGNLIVKPIVEEVVTRAGLKVSAVDTRGKKDIVSAKIVLSDRKDALITGNIVYYPMFAAQPFILDGEEVYVVNAKDVVLVKRSDE